MKRKSTTITKEYDNEGNLISETTETVEEEDSGYIFPQYPTYPTYPTYWGGLDPTKVTCTSTSADSGKRSLE